MTLQRLTKTAPSSEALIRVYQGKAVLNKKAATLLDLHKDDLVLVCYDQEAYAAREVKRLYIGKTPSNGYKVKQRNDTFFVCSAVLCRSIASCLDGYGTYRICPEDFTRNIHENKYYNIFFKKYD